MTAVDDARTTRKRPRRPGFTVVVATDGSPQARAVVAAAAAFPWPEGTRARVVLARGGLMEIRWPGPVWLALTRGFEQVALEASLALRARLSEVDVAVVDQVPVEGILSQARSLRASSIVVGSRGQGMLGRFLLGSVSRGVVRRAPCAVLVVKGRPREIRRLVVGLDGSAHSRHAAAFVAGLAAPRDSQVTILGVVEMTRLPSLGQLPSAVRGRLLAAEARLNRQRLAGARREVEAAASLLRRAGWRVTTAVRAGVPLPELLRAVSGARADLLVLGARGVGGIERHLLGSVAEGALTRSPVSVLVVR